MHHGVSFNFGSTKACSPAKFETSFSYDCHNCAISIDSCSSVNKIFTAS